jgi:hypothetical protein
MSSALILGEPGSGLTTFIGLLYTAQVRYGTEESDEFRFHADRESIRALMGIYGSLGAGQFPEGEVDLTNAPLSFVFGFRRHGLSFDRSAGTGEDPHFSTLRLSVGGETPHDLQQLRDHDVVLDEPFRQMLRSPVLLLLVDASWLTSEIHNVAGIPMARYDASLAATLGLLERFLESERDRRRRRMFPIFVVTKFDRITPEAQNVLGVPPAPPSTWETWTRARVGQRLLEHYLPETHRMLSGRRPGKVVIDAPVWFFSGLRVQETPTGDRRILRRERIPVGGWEPEYPFEEYRALIDHLRQLVQRLPQEEAA